MVLLSVRRFDMVYEDHPYVAHFLFPMGIGGQHAQGGHAGTRGHLLHVQEVLHEAPHLFYAMLEGEKGRGALMKLISVIFLNISAPN